MRIQPVASANDGIAALSHSTVHLVDDDRARRTRYDGILSEAGFDTRSHDDADSLMAALRDGWSTAVVVASVDNPLMDGLGLIRDLYDQGQPLPVILVDGDAAVPTVVRVMKAGAVDYLVRPVAADTLVAAVGQAVELAEAIGGSGLLPADAAERVSTLTPREREIMNQLVRGRSNKDIARDFDISPRTVEIHRGRVMVKMRARNLAELVRMVISVSHHFGTTAEEEAPMPRPRPEGGGTHEGGRLSLKESED
jgi:two-component system response regulator FixJ